MRILGVTGGIGAGKSTVSGLLQRNYGAEIIDTDKISRKIYEIGAPAYEKVLAQFGREYLREDGSIDRKKLAGLVFTDEEALKRLNAIAHPAIQEEVERRLPQAKGLAVVDGALLIEAGFYRLVDKLLLVTADMEVRLARIMQRDGCTRQQALDRVASQMPDEEKKRYADIVLDNSLGMDALERRLAAAMEELEER